MSYVDGFVVPVPKKKLAAYRRMAAKAGKIWREHGALEFRECIADDVKWGKRTSFPRSVKQKTGETVMFSYIVYKSRAARDRINAKGMKDKRPAKMMNPKAMPLEAKGMFGGGFKTGVALWGLDSISLTASRRFRPMSVIRRFPPCQKALTNGDAKWPT